jgi:hypothetical protein
MSVHRYLLRPRVGASAKVAEVGVADKDRMRSGHVGLFEAEEHVIFQVGVALGVDEERVADAAPVDGNFFPSDPIPKTGCPVSMAGNL